MRTMRPRPPSGGNGFTLIEVIVVVAILGILAAILIPTLTGLLGEGEEAALSGDVSSVQLAADEFTFDRHAGPDISKEWGLEPKRRLSPTEDGEVGDIELNVDEEDPGQPGNLRVHVFIAGPSIGATATDDQIDDSLVWLGLLVQEPHDVSGAAQQTTGDASPQGNEEGGYLPEFPESAHADNTARDPSGSYTDGSYRYVLLHNGKIAAVYKSDANWYAGYDDVYP